jgi:hypothetical protein
MTKIQTIEHFIQKFTAISDDQWCENSLQDAFGRRCALGHCLIDTSLPIKDCESERLTALFRHCLSVPLVNDGCDSRYQQRHPKLRILAALNDLLLRELADLPSSDPQSSASDAPAKTPHQSRPRTTVVRTTLTTGA